MTVCLFCAGGGVYMNSLFLTGKPGQQTGQAENGLAQEDVDQK
jgi:hypothetical protein